MKLENNQTTPEVDKKEEPDGLPRRKISQKGIHPEILGEEKRK